MKSKIYLILIIVLFSNCENKQTVAKMEENALVEKKAINKALNTWHKNAAAANYKNYFNAMDTNFNFIGTDASENWYKKEFEVFSKPFFDRGKAWNLIPLKRNVYILEDQKLAWFDEILKTWMGVCRGSGIVIKRDTIWKIQHYVLSLTIPNDNIDEVIKINKLKDSIFIKKLEK